MIAGNPNRTGKKLHQFKGRRCNECARESYCLHHEARSKKSRIWQLANMERHRDNCRRWQGDNRARMRLYTYKSVAKRRGMSFNISDEFFFDLITGVCFYCHAPGNPLNGIDRVNNSLGYTHGNVVSCCETCNKAKGVKSVEQFINWLRMAYSVSVEP